MSVDRQNQPRISSKFARSTKNVKKPFAPKAENSSVLIDVPLLKIPSFQNSSENLLDSIWDFCEHIQSKGFQNIRDTKEIMVQFNHLKSFKQNIDQQWEKIQQKMLEFLKNDEQMIKQFSDTKRKLIQFQEKIQACSNSSELTEVRKSLQEEAGVKVMANYIKFNQIQQNTIDSKLKSWKKAKQQIHSGSQILKEYAVKIIQIVTDAPQNELSDPASLKNNAKEYFKLRSQLINELSFKNKIETFETQKFCDSSDKSTTYHSQNEQQILSKAVEKNSKKFTSRRKQNPIIEKILNLYKSFEV